VRRGGHGTGGSRGCGWGVWGWLDGAGWRPIQPAARAAPGRFSHRRVARRPLSSGGLGWRREISRDSRRRAGARWPTSWEPRPAALHRPSRSRREVLATARSPPSAWGSLRSTAPPGGGAGAERRAGHEQRPSPTLRTRIESPHPQSPPLPAGGAAGGGAPPQSSGAPPRTTTSSAQSGPRRHGHRGAGGLRGRCCFGAAAHWTSALAAPARRGARAMSAGDFGVRATRLPGARRVRGAGAKTTTGRVGRAYREPGRPAGGRRYLRESRLMGMGEGASCCSTDRAGQGVGEQTRSRAQCSRCAPGPEGQPAVEACDNAPLKDPARPHPEGGRRGLR
jgi:hypothetical protein